MRIEHVPPDVRLRLARDIKKARKSEREFAIGGDSKYAYKRDRSLMTYRSFLVGLGATLRYVGTLSSQCVVDLGAGTGRAMAELEQSDLGSGLEFVGTGLLWDKSQILKNYRITPAEIMRDFSPSSVGAILSVFGPIHYSDHLQLVLGRIDDMLVSGGAFKCALMIKSSLTPTRDVYHQHVLKTLETFFVPKGYGLAIKEKTVDEGESIFTYRAVLAVKGDSQNLIASHLVEEDEKTFPKDHRPA